MRRTVFWVFIIVCIVGCGNTSTGNQAETEETDPKETTVGLITDNNVVVDGIRYHIDEGEAEVTGDTSFISRFVSIPESFEYEGKTYMVTSIYGSAFGQHFDLSSVSISDNIKSIGAFAFANCVSLNSIIIPENVVTIGQNAFDGCCRLYKVYSLIKEPFELEPNIFDKGIKDEATLYVPNGTYEKYISAGWDAYFDNILEMEPSASPRRPMEEVCQ